MSFQIEVNPKLDLAEIQADYSKNGFTQVKNFFTDESANKLAQLIQKNEIWNLAYNDSVGYYESPISEFYSLTEEKQQAMLRAIESRASSHFQYFFLQYYVSQAIELGEEKGHPLHQVHEFLNSQSYLDLMKFITNDDSIKKADSYISRYEQGHFLTEHDDSHTSQDRVAACTFGFTKDWNINWGGQLVFYDKEGNIKQGYKPSFNTLNLLSVPQSHAVQQVNNSAKQARYSLLSWLQR